MGQTEEAGSDELRMLKHDIRNQLSNIFLALEQLKYEVPETSDDGAFYVKAIADSCTKINTLLNKTD